jgi:hypothetical protein
MNKIKESLKENIITKERLKMKIENQIENKQTKKVNNYFKPVGFAMASLVILFLVGFIVLNNGGSSLNNREFHTNKELFTSQMSNSANYSMTIFLNLDSYLVNNNLVSYHPTPLATPTLLSTNSEEIIEIDARDIVYVEEFTECNGTVIVERDEEAFNYTINAECSNDPAGAST